MIEGTSFNSIIPGLFQTFVPLRGGEGLFLLVAHTWRLANAKNFKLGMEVMLISFSLSKVMIIYNKNSSRGQKKTMQFATKGFQIILLNIAYIWRILQLNLTRNGTINFCVVKQIVSSSSNNNNTNNNKIDVYLVMMDKLNRSNELGTIVNTNHPVFLLQDLIMNDLKWWEEIKWNNFSTLDLVK